LPKKREKQFNVKLVNPANKRKYDVIAWWAPAWRLLRHRLLAELFHNVKAFTTTRPLRALHRRAGRCAATKTTRTTVIPCSGCYDTVKGGDYRAMTNDIYRLAPGIGQYH
jgi:succinate dehydrogenase / fumarate reductase flavoprotein subunit